MNMDVMVTGPFGVNCYLLSKDGNLVIIDPGGNLSDIEKYISGNKLMPVAIVNTHGHFDHIGAVRGLCVHYNIPFYLHPDDEFLAAQGGESMRRLGLGDMQDPIVTDHLHDGQILEIGGIKMEVMHTPGHTPGGCCLYVYELNTVFTGDTLFYETVGRSDFPYADGEQLIKNVKEKLLVLDDSVHVCPGHGEASTIGHEKRYNPYV